MSATVTHAEADVCNFVEALRQLPDHRDNRGKRHALAFVVAGVVWHDLEWTLESLEHLSLSP